MVLVENRDQTYSSRSFHGSTTGRTMTHHELNNCTNLLNIIDIMNSLTAQTANGSANHRVTLGCYTRDFDAPCETGRLYARKRLIPWPLSPQYSRMSPSPSNLGVFVCAKGAAAADEAGGDSVEAGNPVASRWLGRVSSVLVSGNRLHFCAGRHQSAGAAKRRNLACQLCRVNVSRARSAALVSAGAVTSYASHSSE